MEGDESKKGEPLKIEKPWGFEIIFACSENYLGKILFIKKGEGLSLQYHRYKDETIFVKKGVLELEIQEHPGVIKILTMHPGSSFRILPKQIHRMKAIEDCEIFEVSTPHMQDVIRIHDYYGRVKRERLALVLAGGQGTRFWPRSRRKKPKQLLDIVGSEPMIRYTIKRILPFIAEENIFVVTSRDYYREITESVSEIPQENIILEPVGKNTGPCIAFSCIRLKKINPDAVLFIFPSDHYIRDEEKFIRALEKAESAAKSYNCIVTFGIAATTPETGYGYIKIGERFIEDGRWDVFKVDRFIEKPTKQEADKLVGEKVYFWNSGIFIGKIQTFLSEIEKYCKELHSGIAKIEGITETDNEERIINEIYESWPEISIDKALMEKTGNLLVMPVDFGWSDVGSWAALDGIIEKREKGNIIKAKHISIDTEGCIIYSPRKLIATIGVRDLILVETEDALLLCNKERAQDVKKLVERLKEEGLEEYL